MDNLVVLIVSWLCVWFLKWLKNFQFLIGRLPFQVCNHLLDMKEPKKNNAMETRRSFHEWKYCVKYVLQKKAWICFWGFKRKFPFKHNRNVKSPYKSNKHYLSYLWRYLSTIAHKKVVYVWKCINASKRSYILCNRLENYSDILFAVI